MEPLLHRLDRSLVIQAAPETVFRFFTDSERWARWWGAGSTIDPRAGGSVYILHPGGVETVGEVLELKPPERIVFTYGYASGSPIPPGGSRVSIDLQPSGSGTRLVLMHEFSDEAVRDHHIQGWRFQLSLFANVILDEVYSDAATKVDAWFEAWAVSGDQERTDRFTAIATEAVLFRDRFSFLEGIAELSVHAGAAQRFMPGIRLKRAGDVRHCQGMVLADWTATGPDGKDAMSGTNVFEFGPDGRFASITGFAKVPAR